MPTPGDGSFDGWMKRITPTASKPAQWESFNYWSNTPKFVVSLLKMMYGDAATKQNEWAFDYLPKVDRDYSWIHLWDDMYNGTAQRTAYFWDERRGHRAGLEEEYRRAEKSGFPGGWRDLSGRDERVLEVARHYARGDEADPNDGVPIAVRGIRGEGRIVYKFGAVAGLEEYGGTDTGRCAAGPGDSRADIPAGA